MPRDLLLGAEAYAKKRERDSGPRSIAKKKNGREGDVEYNINVLCGFSEGSLEASYIG